MNGGNEGDDERGFVDDEDDDERKDGYVRAMAREWPGSKTSDNRDK